jgi:hypothetical protein
MPDGTTEIFIDSSFFEVDPGETDAHSAFLVKEPDNIGQRDTPIIYELITGKPSIFFTAVEVFTSSSGELDGSYINTIAEFKTVISGAGMEICLVDYSVPVTISGLERTEDFELKYFTGYTQISGNIGSKLKYTAGQLYASSFNILHSYRQSTDKDLELDYTTFYTAGGDYDPLIPGPPIDQVVISGIQDFRHYFRMGYIVGSGVVLQECDLFLAGYPMEFSPEKYTYRFHLTAGDTGSRQAAEWEATVISGSVLDIPLDVYSTATTSGYYNFDSVCGKTSFSGLDFPVDLVSYSFNSEVISGTIGYYHHESICSIPGTNGYTFDVDLLSLKISNFSLAVEDYSIASGPICVDITDDVYNVLSYGSYFIIDETITSGNMFIPITDGYRMCYNPPDDFSSLIGATTVIVHTENDDGDVLEQYFYLTSGYIVEYDNLDFDYGLGTQVVVRASAENLASCPDAGAEAYFFTTVIEKVSNLGATIESVPLDRILVTPSGVLLDAVVGTQQYTAELYDVENTLILGVPFVWRTDSGGTIDNNGLFIAGTKKGVFNNAVVASFGGLEGYASVEIDDGETVYYYGKTFRIEIRAKDFAGNVMEPLTFEFKIEDEPE